MLKDNLVDLDKIKNKKILDFIIKALAHDFSPFFNIKIKYRSEIYKLSIKVDKI